VSAAAGAVERVVLVGFMGAGKSTVGRRLAHQLDWGFLDLDTWIEEHHGCRIAALFVRHGEAWFREQERAAAARAATLKRVVVAAGGGAFAQPATRAILRRGALTVYLQAAPDTLLRRIRPDGSRPLASNRAKITELLAAREPSYRLADVTLDTTRLRPEAVARAIAARVVGVGSGGPS
jgi:shikimate kinase